MDHIQLSKGLSCIRDLMVFSPAEEVDGTRRQGATAVSYTHLDVYKRQQSSHLGFKVPIFCPRWA